MSDGASDSNTQQLIQKCEAGRARCKRLLLIRNILTVVLMATILTWIYSIYRETAEMWSAKNFEQPLQEQGEVLRPIVAEALQDAAKKVVPEYVRTAQEKFGEVQPELEKRVLSEARTLAFHSSDSAQKAITQSMKRIYLKEEKAWRQDFPNLATDEGSKLFHDQMQQLLEESTHEVMLHFLEHHGVNIEKLQATLDTFRSDRFKGVSDEDMARYYAHLWLTLLDHQIVDGIKIQPAMGDSHASK